MPYSKDKVLVVVNTDSDMKGDLLPPNNSIDNYGYYSWVIKRSNLNKLLDDIYMAVRDTKCSPLLLCLNIVKNINILPYSLKQDNGNYSLLITHNIK